MAAAEEDPVTRARGVDVRGRDEGRTPHRARLCARAWGAGGEEDAALR